MPIEALGPNVINVQPAIDIPLEPGDPVQDITLGVTAAVEKFGAILDQLEVPTTTVVAGGVQQLTPEGRIMKLAEQRDQAVADAAARLLNQPDPDALIKAKTLLSEAFKWLSGFEQTADLRQRIILFMEN